MQRFNKVSDEGVNTFANGLQINSGLQKLDLVRYDLIHACMHLSVCLCLCVFFEIRDCEWPSLFFFFLVCLFCVF